MFSFRCVPFLPGFACSIRITQPGAQPFAEPCTPSSVAGQGDPSEEDDRRAAPEVRARAAGRDAAVRAPHDHLLQPPATPTKVQRRTSISSTTSSTGRSSQGYTSSFAFRLQELQCLTSTWSKLFLLFLQCCCIRRQTYDLSRIFN